MNNFSIINNSHTHNLYTYIFISICINKCLNICMLYCTKILNLYLILDTDYQNHRHSKY